MNINQNFTSIRQMQETYLHQRVNIPDTKSPEQADFQDILRQKTGLAEAEEETLKFSKHAGARLADRQIHLTAEQLDRLEKGTKKADEKGIQESLMIMDNLSFIVNIKHRTVITAMDHSGSEENVYTNIDGAVIV